MARRFLLIPAMTTVAWIFFSSLLMAQSREEGINLFNEARSIQENARSREDLEKAVDKYEQAVRIFESVRFNQGIGVTSNSIGMIYSYWGSYDKAVEHFEKSLAKFREVKDLKGEGNTLNNLGIVYSHWGKYDKAAEYYERVLSIFRELKDRKGEAATLNNLGLIRAHWGRQDNAVDCYQKALSISRQIQDRRTEGQTLGNLGNVYLDWAQYDKAGEYFEKSLEVFHELNDYQSEGTALNNLGLVFANQGQYDKAIEYYERSLKIAGEMKDPAGEGRVLNNLGSVYKDWNQYDKAVEHYEKSLKIARSLRDPKSEGRVLNNLGLVNSSWGRFSKAVEYYERSLKINREIKDPAGEGMALNNLGLVHLDWGQYVKAVECFDESLNIERKIKDRRGEGQLLNNLGTVYKDWGQYAKALAYHQQSLAVAKEINDRVTQAQSLNNLGLVYSDWGQYAKALEYYEKSCFVKKELKDRKGEAHSLGNQGTLYASWGQYDKAVECYEKALAIFRETKERKDEGIALNNLGSLYSTQGDYDKALTSFQSGLEIYANIGVPTAGAKDLIGNLYLDKGECEKAEPFVKEAGYPRSLGRLALIKQDYSEALIQYGKIRQSTEASRNVDGLFTAYTGLGTAFEGLGENRNAEECYLKAIALTEDLRSTLPKPQRETFFDVRINGFLRTAPYDGLVRVRIKMNKTVEAFRDSEYTKSRIFAEIMSRWSESNTFDIPQDVLTRDKELNDQRAALKKKRQEGYEKANQEILSVIDSQVKEIESKLHAHIKMLRKKYPLFAATKYPQPMNLSEMALEDDEWVLTYHVTDPGIIIYLSKGKVIVKAFYKPIRRGDLENLVSTFRKPMEIVPGKDKFIEKLGSFDLAMGRRLSEVLVSDILALLPKNAPLLIVPDDSLGTLPFEMLVLNDTGTLKTDKDLPYVSGAEFFGDRNLICYAQSGTALTLSRVHAKAKTAQSGMVALADPVFQEKDERASKASKQAGPTGVMASLLKRLNLMAAENDPQMGGLKFQRLSMTGELAQYLAGMGQKNSLVYTGLDAAKDKFLAQVAPKLNQYDEVVFATHGYFGKDLPGIMEPVLVLTLVPPGTDGFLRMSEVMGLDMNADIVALTACQTGLGKRTAGEGTMGMGRAFQYAGARSVLMSLWSVSEVASVNLVKSFFQSMRNGKRKSEALTEARNEVRKKGFDHPFFWAGFILVGEAN